MKDKIAEVIRYEIHCGYDGELIYVRDGADKILSLLKEEIEKELDGREEDMIADVDYKEGWLDCKHWVLKILES